MSQRTHQKMMGRINGNDIINTLHEISIVFSRSTCIAITHIDDDNIDPYVNIMRGGKNKYIDIGIYPNGSLDDPLATLIIYICSSSLIKDTKNITLEYTDEHCENLIKLIDSIMNESDWHLWQYGRKEALGSISTYYSRDDIPDIYRLLCAITTYKETGI